MALATPGSLLVSRAFDPLPVSPGSGEVVTQAASNRLVVARGGVGKTPRDLAREDQRPEREGFLRALWSGMETPANLP
jgi:hypothetical protein